MQMLETWINDFFDDFTSGLIPLRSVVVSMVGVEVNDQGKKSMRYKLDLPGVKKDDIAINVDELNCLTIVSKRGARTLHHYVNVPHAYDAKQTDASLEDGVLTLVVQLRSQPVASRIAIR